MTKKQNIWVWIFISMFAIPEFLFFFAISFLDFFGLDISSPIYFFISHQFFIDNPTYLLIAHVIEWLGVLGLLILSIKNKKKTYAILLGVVLLWLSVYFYFGYVVSTMNLSF